MIYIPILITIAGLLIYALSSKPKIMEIGRLMFAIGLLSWLLGGMKI